MRGPDLEVIKEIPGYKVILKAVLKSQIQQLVEQIASETEEETVVLSANLTDGSISYHGSESGKSFLDSHDEFKSQFLGFCLKRLHNKGREHVQDGIKESTRIEYGLTLPEYHSNSSQMWHNLKRTDRGLRHEPYKKSKGKGKLSNLRVTPQVSPSLQDNDSSDNIVIKMEHDADSYNKVSADIGSTELQHSESQVSESVETYAENNQTIPGSYAENSSLNEHVPSINSYSDQSQSEMNNSNLGSDCIVNIKQELNTDLDTDLKITGMELPTSGFVHEESLPDGISAMLDNSRDMSFNSAGVAMGTTLDVQSKHRVPKKNYITNTLQHMKSAYNDNHTGGNTDQSFKRYKPVSRLTEEEKQRRREMDRERQRRHRERIKAINFMFQNKC